MKKLREQRSFTVGKIDIVEGLGVTTIDIVDACIDSVSTRKGELVFIEGKFRGVLHTIDKKEKK